MKFSKRKTSSNQEYSISVKTASKIGLFNAITIIISGVVGIGIFFKNNSVFQNNNGNGVGVLISWIISFIIAISTAYSFGEIVTCKTKNVNSGLGGWTERFSNYSFGRYIKILLPLSYYCVYMLVNSFFCGESILNFNSNDSGKFTNPIWMVCLISILLVSFFIVCNLFISKFLQKFASITTIVKFIPLVTICIAGIIIGILNPDFNLFTHPGNIYNAQTKSGEFSFTGILDSIPAILFAFDSFLIIGNIAGEMENPRKNVPVSLVLSLLISGVLYLLVTIGQIVCGCGSAYLVFDLAFKNNLGVQQAFHIIISIFIFIATLGTVNSMIMGGIRSLDSAVEEEVVAWSAKIKKISKGKYLVSGAILFSFILCFYFSILYIPSMIFNTDQIMDGVSNVVVILFFLFYGINALLSFINRYTNKVTEVNKQKLQKTFSMISFVGILFVFCYSAFYKFLTYPIINPNGSFETWGLFHDNTKTLTQLEAAIWFWALMIVMSALPLINDLLIKLFNKKYNMPLIWEKQRNNKNISIKK